MADQNNTDHSISTPADWLIGVAALWLFGYLMLFYAVPFDSGTPRGHLVWLAVSESVLALLDRSSASIPFGLTYLQQRGWVALHAVAIIVAGLGWGLLLIRLMEIRSALGRMERAVFGYGVGMLVLSVGMLVGGLLGFMNRTAIIGLLVAGPVAEIAARLWKRIQIIRTEWRQHLETQAAVRDTDPVARQQTRCSAGVLVLVALCLPFLLLIFLGAMLPPLDFDVKEYHLQAPKEFYLQGRITFLPHNIYSSMPLGTEMLSLLAMIVAGDWWWGALVGQTVLASFAPMTALALVAAGKRFFSVRAGVIAAAIYLGTPAIFQISSTAFVEGGLAFYLALALVAWALAAEKYPLDCVKSPRVATRGLWCGARELTRRAGLVLLAGLFAGAAGGCKYPGLVYVALPLAVAGGFQMVRSRTAGTAGLFLCGLLIGFGPWLLRNTVDTGNPVYPLLWDVFDGRSWNADQNARWWRVHGPPDFGLDSLRQSVSVVTVLDTGLSPLLWGLAPLALLRTGSRRRAAVLLGYVLVVLAAWWLLTHRIDRFWWPVIPALALLAGAGADWTIHRFWRRAVGVLVAAVLVSGVFFSGIMHLGWKALSDRGGRVNEGWGAYLVDLHWARHHFPNLAVQYINHRLPPDARILAVGEAAVFDFQRSVYYNTAFDDSLFEQWLAFGSGQSDRLRPAREIRRLLAEHGVTHIYVDWAEIARYRSPGNYGYSPFVTPERFQDLLRGKVLELVIQWSSPLESLPAGSEHVYRQWPQLVLDQNMVVSHALYAVRDVPAEP